MESAISSIQVKEQARALGFDLVGVCPAVEPPHFREYQRWIEKGYGGTMDYLREHLPLKEHPSQLLPGAKSIIMVGLNYNQPNPATEGQPRIARYALGRDYHKVLRSKLKRLESQVCETFPGSECRPCVDSAPIMERDFAQLAGLGFFGKNTMLINPRMGSWFFLGALITTVEFEPDPPFEGHCGRCTRCIDACPTGALIYEDQRWQVDARRCISYLTIEHEGPLGPDETAGWTFGCDVCQEVCPFNESRPSQPLRAATTNEPDFLRRRSWPNLEQLRQLEEGEWNLLTQGSPVRRAGLSGLRRNAAANLQYSRARRPE